MWRRPGAMKEFRLRGGIGDDLGELHPAAALREDVDGEEPGEELRPADPAWGRRRPAEPIGRRWDGERGSCIGTSGCGERRWGHERAG